MTAASHAEPSTAVWPVADLRAYLAGSWTISRTMEDRRRGALGRFEGQAGFTSEGEDLLAYREVGRLALGGFETVAHRRYLYAFPAPRAAPHRPPHRAEVRFADGRPFHDLDLSDGLWTAGHRCAPDTYRGRFRALGPDRWWARWIVTGPRKDQVLESLFTRGA